MADLEVDLEQRLACQLGAAIAAQCGDTDNRRPRIICRVSMRIGQLARINLFALAIRHGLTAEDLRTTMFAYPTGASDIGYMVS